MDNLQLPLDHDIADVKLRLALQHNRSPPTVGIKDILQDDDSSVEAMWKIYMKAKDLLPWKERMENLTWRLMYMESENHNHPHPGLGPNHGHSHSHNHHMSAGNTPIKEDAFDIMYIDLHQAPPASSLDINNSQLKLNARTQNPVPRHTHSNSGVSQSQDTDFEMREPDDIFEDEFDYASHIKKLGQEVIDDISNANNPKNSHEAPGASPQNSQNFNSPPKTSFLSMSLRNLLAQQSQNQSQNQASNQSQKQSDTPHHDEHISSSYDFNLESMALEGPSGNLLESDFEYPGSHNAHEDQRLSPPSRPHTTIGPQSILQNFKQFSHHSQIHQQIHSLAGNEGSGAVSVPTNKIPGYNRTLFRQEHSLVNLNDHFPKQFGDTPLLSDSAQLSLPTDSYMGMGMDSAHHTQRPFSHRSSLGLMSLPPSSGVMGLDMGVDSDANLRSPERDSYFDDHLAANNLHSQNSSNQNSGIMNPQGVFAQNHTLSRHFSSFDGHNPMLNGPDSLSGANSGVSMDHMGGSASTTPTSNFMGANMNSSLPASLTSNSSTATITPVSVKKNSQTNISGNNNNNNNNNNFNKKSKAKSFANEAGSGLKASSLPQSGSSSLSTSPNKSASINGKKKLTSGPSKESNEKSSARSSKKKSVSPDSSNVNIQCTNCHTRTTPLWRRNPKGEPLCNACGLFLKLHGVVRPLSLKTDVIKKRQRGQGSSSRKNSSTNLAASLSGMTGNSPSSSTSILNLNITKGPGQTNSNLKLNTVTSANPNSDNSSSIYHDGDDFNPTAILGNTKKKSRKPKSTSGQGASKTNSNSKGIRKSGPTVGIPNTMNSPAVMSSVGTPSVVNSHPLDSVSNTPTSGPNNPLEFEARNIPFGDPNIGQGVHGQMGHGQMPPFGSVTMGSQQYPNPHGSSHSLQFDQIQGSPHSNTTTPQHNFPHTDGLDVMPSIDESGDNHLIQNSPHSNAYLFGQEAEAGDGNWDWLKMAL